MPFARTVKRLASSCSLEKSLGPNRPHEMSFFINRLVAATGARADSAAPTKFLNGSGSKSSEVGDVDSSSG